MSHPVPLQVAVVGAGAVGCYFGGMLARAGHHVTLLARPQHVEAIRRDGLRMETRTFDERVRVQADTDPRALRRAEVVLFCVKSMDTEATGRDIAPFLAPAAVVLCLQNGVDNAERLRPLLAGHEVGSAVVYVGTEMAGPGHVKHHGRGELVIDPTRVSAPLAQALVAAGVPTEVSQDVRGALWLKLILNCAYNAVSAIAQMPYGAVVQAPGIPGVIRDVVDECLAVARAEDVQVAGDVDAAVRRIVETMPAQYASTAQDLARGKPTEIDYLNGFVDRRGKARGVPTPVNRTLWALVKLLEGKRG